MIRTFDLHDRAYYLWRDAGVRGATLVHIDAHHDAAVEPAWKAIDIGNFVRAAMRHGLVERLLWVVPDPMWEHEGTREILEGELADIRLADDRIWMGPLDQLPAHDGPLLLDIDLDYLVTVAYDDGRSAEPLDRPWRAPEALARSIGELALHPIVTTIAMSVTGGFTPLHCAHYAQVIAAALEQTAPPRCDAAGLFNEALALQSAGRLDEARTAYGAAIAIDPFYAHPFRTRGPYLLRRGRLQEAARVFESALELDPADPHALLGLAMVALGQDRWVEATTFARRSLAGNPDAIDGWRTLGLASARLGDLTGAIHAYGRALSLGLHGASPLGGPWTSNPTRRIVDPKHWDDHRALAELHELAGSREAAAAHRRMAAAGAAVLPS
jgi:tetratricopeptide (TPR) repeat protein